MEEDAWVALAFLVSIALIIWLFLYYGYKKRTTIHKTIRAAIDKGQEISPETIHHMSQATNPRRGDLRKGVVLVSISIAVLLIGLINLINHGGEESEVFLSIAVVPGMIGAAFLALWRFGYDGETD